MESTSQNSRRQFIKQSAMAGAALAMPNAILANAFGSSKEMTNDALQVFIFSKHLQFLNYTDMCEAAKEMGFDGVDLTVRPKGHVLPERVVDDLPRVTETMKAHGLLPLMFSSNVLDAKDKVQQQVLKTGSQLGYQFYRPNWMRYNTKHGVQATLANAQQQFRALSELNQKYNISASYHNHSGNFFGSAVWDLHQAIQNLPKDYFGSQYDIMHATVEGGKSWEFGLELIHPWINTIVVKDFIWKKKNGSWQVQHVPMGEGMVDFKRFFILLKQYQINVPVSIHVEYDLGGAEHGGHPSIDKKEVFRRIKHDLDYVREIWKQV